MHAFPLNRRRWLQHAGFASAVTSAGLLAPGWAAASPSAAAGLAVAQCVDLSAAQQDVSRDFLIGSRAAWQDINLRGGLRGRRIEHRVLETDGSAASLQAALGSVVSDPSCVALSGCVGDALARQLLALSQAGRLNLAQAAPWLQNASLAIDDKTFPIFAAYQEQIVHACKSLSSMGMTTLGAVYASPALHNAWHAEVERIATSLQLRLQTFKSTGDLRALGATLTAQSPAMLLFVGGTPELAQFAQGLQKQARQRYLVALADVNLNTLMQMGTARSTPVIATQPVPPVNASLPVVRRYRETLARLFDEAPSPLGLAGFIAARYTFEVLSTIEGAVTRQSALSAFQKRTELDVGGFRVSFNAQHRSAGYVTQSMMTPDGRQIG